MTAKASVGNGCLVNVKNDREVGKGMEKVIVISQLTTNFINGNSTQMGRNLRKGIWESKYL